MGIDYDRISDVMAHIQDKGLNTAEMVTLLNDLLEVAFPWADAPQSAEYWAKISDALEEVANMYEESHEDLK